MTKARFIMYSIVIDLKVDRERLNYTSKIPGVKMKVTWVGVVRKENEAFLWSRKGESEEEKM